MKTYIIVSIVLYTLLVTSARGATIPAAVDAEKCIELCSSCDGIAEYENGHCECSISSELDNGMECLTRMKRQARVYGLDLVSCDSNAETRATRCALGSKHAYSKAGMEQVAKYFMQDGPLTGSIFIAPPIHPESMVGQSAGGDCNLGSSQGSTSQGLITQPASTLPEAVGSPQTSTANASQSPKVGQPLIVQPKEFMPTDAVSSPASSSPVAAANPKSTAESVGAAPASPKLAATIPKLGADSVSASLDALGIQHIAPQFLSMLGEVMTKPILGLPKAIQSFSEIPGMSQLVGAPGNLLNSLADQMAQSSQTAKDNLDNYRQVVGKAQEDAKVSQAKPKESDKNVGKSNPTVGSSQSRPSYSLTNPQPMLSWMNPTVGAAAPTQFVGSPSPMQFIGSQTPMQLVGAAAPTQFVNAAPASMQFLGAAPGSTMQLIGAPMMTTAQLVGAAVPSQLVSSTGQNQMVGAAAPDGSGCGGQMVGASAPSSQMVAAASPMISAMPVIQSLGTIPLSSIVSQMSPTYLVGSPMTYYPAMQSGNGENVGEPQSLEEVPLSSPPQKKICKKSTRDHNRKYTRDVKAVEENKEKTEEKVEEMTTTTTTTEVPMIERTTTQKPKEKTKEDKSVITKIKPPSKIKADKKIVKRKV